MERRGPETGGDDIQKNEGAESGRMIFRVERGIDREKQCPERSGKWDLENRGVEIGCDDQPGIQVMCTIFESMKK